MVKKYPDEGLDEPCQRIFQFLVVNFGGIGFNQLHKELEKKGYPMSTPTLSFHLKEHLVKKWKLVRSQKVGIQRINYEVDRRKWKALKKTADRLLEIEKALEKEKAAFYTDPLDTQVNLVLEIMFRKEVEELKTLVSIAVDPENTFENRLKLTLLNKGMFMLHERLLLARCRENPEYGKKVGARLENYLEEIQSKQLKFL